MRTAVLVVLLAVTGCWGFEDKSIAQWLSENGFTTLVTNLKAAGLFATLNGGGPFTVFAPTDAAFSQVPNDTLANLAANPSVLTTVLQYHVIGGFVVQPMIKTGFSKVALNGQELHFTKDATSNALRVQQSLITSGDNILNNGVVHVINSVMLPVTDTIPEVLLKKQPQFADLILALTVTQLFPDLMATGSSFTLFAPSNDAFNAIQSVLPDFSDPNAKSMYTEILKNHVVNGTFFAKDLRDGQSLPTLHGTNLNVDINAPSVTVGGAGVIQADIEALNGVIHVINQVIMPNDIP